MEGRTHGCSTTRVGRGVGGRVCFGVWGARERYDADVWRMAVLRAGCSAATLLRPALFPPTPLHQPSAGKSPITLAADRFNTRLQQLFVKAAPCPRELSGRLGGFTHGLACVVRAAEDNPTCLSP